MDQLRVLWVTPTLGSSFGGPSTTTVNGVIAESRAGLRTELITTVSRDAEPTSPGVERLVENRIKVRLFHRLGGIGKSEAWGLSPGLTIWMLRNIRSFDIIHLQYVWCWSSIWGCILGSIFSVPIVMTPHESLTDYDIDVASRSRVKRAVKLTLRHLFLATVDCLVFMSELEVRDTRYGSLRHELISHAVVEEAADMTSPQSSLAEEPLRIAFLGRNVAKKGIDRIIMAMGNNRERGWQLLVAGPPGSEGFVEECQKLSEELGVSKDVRWLGFIDSKEDFFSQCDVLAMPSAYEGFGMVSAEAMSHGVPVIVPRMSGVAEIVSEYKAGIVLDEPTVEALGQALKRFDMDRNSWPAFRENGIRAVNERLTYGAYAAAISELYASLL